MKSKAVRTLIVEHSPVFRNFLATLLPKDPNVEVCGTATDPFDARAKIIALEPDVIVLDAETPRMSGLVFLEKIMNRRPTPVIMCTSPTADGAQVAMRALESGAVDAIAKPALQSVQALEEMARDLTERVKVAAQSKDIKRQYARLKGAALLRQRVPALGALQDMSSAGQASRQRRRSPRPPAIIQRELPLSAAGRVIAIGASTGGTEAIREVLARLPASTPGIVIVQHMPAEFTTAFSKRLNELCEMEVREARNGDKVRQGRALIAPGGFHMRLRRHVGSGFDVAVEDGPLVCRHKPSVDVLFRSVAEVAGDLAVGAMLTGMGADGAEAMKVMKDAGASNIAQDEDSCVVFGMPNEAILAGAVDRVVPIERVAQAILDYLGGTPA